MFKSEDGGRNWNTINAGLADKETAVSILVVDPLVPTTLYAGTWDGGVFRSTNGGGNWSAVNTGLTSLNVRALAIDPRTPSALYVGTAYDGVFKSTNSGDSWNPINTGLPTEINRGIRSLAIDPKTPTTLYVQTLYYVAFKSTDGGGIWNSITGLPAAAVESLAIDPQTPNLVYVGPALGSYDLLKSTDGGVSWRNIRVETCCINSLAIDPDTPTILYAGWGYTLQNESESGIVFEGEGGVIQSTDAGETWRQVDYGLPDSEVRVMAIDPLTPTTVYAATGDGVFRSTSRRGD